MREITIVILLFVCFFAKAQKVIQNDGKYGVQEDSVWVLPLIFDSISEFTVEGKTFYWVRENNYEGIFTSDGDFEVPYDFDKVRILAGNDQNWSLEVPSGEIGLTPIFMESSGKVGFRSIQNGYTTPTLIDYSHANLEVIRNACLKKAKKVTFMVNGKKTQFDLRKGVRLN